MHYTNRCYLYLCFSEAVITTYLSQIVCLCFTGSGDTDLTVLHKICVSYTTDNSSAELNDM